jgi:hypothetical protein
MHISVISNFTKFLLRNVEDNSLNTRIIIEFRDTLIASIISKIAKGYKFIRTVINKMSINIAVYVLFSVLS